MRLFTTLARVLRSYPALATAILVLPLAGVETAALGKDICDACIEVRVEYPHVVRGRRVTSPMRRSVSLSFLTAIFGPLPLTGPRWQSMARRHSIWAGAQRRL